MIRGICWLPQVAVVLISVAGVALAIPAARAEILVRQPQTVGQFDVRKHNEAQFRSGFPLTIRPKVSQLGDVELKRHIESLRLGTLAGFSIKAFDYDKGSNIIVGTSQQNAGISINVIEKAQEGKNVVVSVQDTSGAFSKVEKNQVGVFDLEGKPLNFEVLKLSEANIEVYFEILLDRSGSMSRFIGQVTQAASDFMALLPKNARCRVTSFNHRFTAHSQSYRPCEARFHKLKGIKASGGTKIYEPLLRSYQRLHAIGSKLKAVIVVTDGMGDSGVSKDAVLKVKSAPTYVYWLGNFKEKRLEGIADTFIYGKQDLKQLLKDFFNRIGSAVNAQQVISVKP